MPRMLAPLVRVEASPVPNFAGVKWRLSERGGGVVAIVCTIKRARGIAAVRRSCLVAETQTRTAFPLLPLPLPLLPFTDGDIKVNRQIVEALDWRAGFGPLHNQAGDLCHWFLPLGKALPLHPPVALEAKDKKRHGGEGGIRTPDTLSGMPVFKTGAINHSATSPAITVLLQSSMAWDRPKLFRPVWINQYLARLARF